MKIHRLLSSLQNGLTKRSSSYIIKTGTKCVGVKQVNEISILDRGVDSLPINSEILEMMLPIKEYVISQSIAYYCSLKRPMTF